MHDLIDDSSIHDLRSAEEIRKIADDASEARQLRNIAYELNSSANVGITSIVYNDQLDDEVIKVLEGQGYSVTRTAQPTNYWDDFSDYQYMIKA